MAAKRNDALLARAADLCLSCAACARKLAIDRAVVNQIIAMPAPERTFIVDDLKVEVFASPADLAAAAAERVQALLQAALAARGEAAAILATGNSQLQFLDALIQLDGVDWSKLTLFHMDEYLGIDAGHKASFRRYLKERVESRVQPRVFHYLQGDAMEPIKECDRYAALLQAQPVELCVLGIGDNGHLAFNDPPVADFNDSRQVKIVALDEVTLKQQVGQGHFASVESMPRYALTLTIPALCSAQNLVCLCPGAHKAGIVARALRGSIDEECPAAILRRQAHATLLLDSAAASRL
jgi:glucosamine-6-phosphate deaminase